MHKLSSILITSLTGVLLSFASHALPTSCTSTDPNVTHKTTGDKMIVKSTSDFASAKFDFTGNTFIAKGKHLDIDQAAKATFVMETDSIQRADVFGKLTSKGSVVMAFPGGVHFKDGSTVNVANLLVVAGKVDHSAFCNQKIKLIPNSGVNGASIINEGDITVKGAGLAAFVAPNALNYGVIIAREDKTYLGDGSAIVDFYGDGLFKFKIPKGIATQSLTKARAKAKELGAQNGILVFDTQAAIDTLQAAVNVKIQNGDSVFLDINEDINIYCNMAPPPSNPTCGANCGCAHGTVNQETAPQETQKSQTFMPSSAQIKTDAPPKTASLDQVAASKDVPIIHISDSSVPVATPCGCGCAHGPAPVALVSSSQPTSVPEQKTNAHIVYKQEEIKPPVAIDQKTLIMSEEIDTDESTIFEIQETGNGEEEVTLKPNPKRKKRKNPVHQ